MARRHGRKPFCASSAALRRTIRLNFFGAPKAGARVGHLSPLDGEKRLLFAYS